MAILNTFHGVRFRRVLYIVRLILRTAKWRRLLKNEVSSGVFYRNWSCSADKHIRMESFAWLSAMDLI